MNQTNSEIKEFFEENGYYLAKGVFSESEVETLETDFDHIVQQLTSSGEVVDGSWKGERLNAIGGQGTSVVHTHNVQFYSEHWLKAMQNANLLDVAEAIIGPDIILHHSKLFQKPSEKGAPFPMHQDWLYFPTENDTMMAAIIHVSEATDEMGCLRVYPGSHRLGRVEDTDGNSDCAILDEYPIESALPLPAELGDVLFFHYFTLHGSMPNRSQEARKTVLVQMHAGDDEVEERGANHPNARLTLRGWNHRVGRALANQI